MKTKTVSILISSALPSRPGRKQIIELRTPYLRGSWHRRGLIFDRAFVFDKRCVCSEPCPCSKQPNLQPLKLEPAKPTETATPADSAAIVPQSINKAAVTGIVTDMSGTRKVEDARVVLTKIGEENRRFQTETKADGIYVFNNIEPGEWSLTTSAKDMLSHTTNVQMVAGETKSIPIHLEDSEPVDVMRITGERTLVHPEKIGSETNLDHKFINQYKSGNDLHDLITSTPGVMNDSYGNIITRGEHNSINYVVDDVVIPEAAGVLQQSTVINPRSIQSMAVDIGGYEASDGCGPLGAVAHIKSLPISSTPSFNIGQQIGGPLAGSIFYNTSGAFSQTDDFWNKFRFESSGIFSSSSYGVAEFLVCSLFKDQPVLDSSVDQRWLPRSVVNDCKTYLICCGPNA